MNAGVSFQKVASPTCSVSRNTALLEDKELATDLKHDRQSLLSQKHLTVVCVIALHSSIDKHQIYSRPLAPSRTHLWTPIPTLWRSSVSAIDTLVQPVSFLSQPAHWCNFLRIFGYGCINQKW